MSRFQTSRNLAISAVAALTLAGCAGDFGARYPITSQLPPEKGLISFSDPLLANARQVRVSHLDAYEHVEYARFETGDATLEAVYDVALNVSLVLEYDYWMAKMADTWNVNRGQAKTWGPAQSVTAWHGKIAYQPYRLTAAGRDCVAFSSDWDYQPRDSLGRPSRVFFGYICAKPGKQLSDPAIASLLKSVAFPTTPVERLVPPNGRRSVDQVAFAAAKGTSGSPTGNAKFPFNFGRTYFDGGDNTKTP
jgi:hypothetical protein